MKTQNKLKDHGTQKPSRKDINSGAIPSKHRRPKDAHELIKYAEKYIRLGWKVFLLAPGSNKPMKGSHSFKDGTDDLDKLRELARKHPDANLAVTTGQESKLFVIDIDRHSTGDGFEVFSRLEEELGTLPLTVIAQTPRGEHRFFCCDERTLSWAANYGSGFDIRGDEGYAAVEPSIVKAGCYRWRNEGEKLAQLPKKWLSAFRRARKRNVDQKMDVDASILEGKRNETLINRAFAIKRQGKSQNEALEQLKEENLRCCKPPLPDKEVIGIVTRAFTYQSEYAQTALNSTIPRATPTTISLATIGEMEFEPLRWALRGILPEGVALLVGPPKIGKSLLCLQMGLAVASGSRLWKGRKPEKEGDVLYIGYEDNHRRMKERASQLMGNRPLPDRLHINYDWPRIDRGGVEALDEWFATRHPKTRLVIIDTLAYFRATESKTRTAYDYDYNVGAILAPLAKKHHVTILLVHHTAKGQRSDPLERINGTMGLSGGVDTTIMLERERGTSAGSLLITGRDVKDRSLAMEKDSKLGWYSTGKLADARRSPERKAILETLKEHGSKKPKAIAELTGKTDESVRRLLSKMRADGEVGCHNGEYSALI